MTVAAHGTPDRLDTCRGLTDLVARPTAPSCVGGGRHEPTAAGRGGPSEVGRRVIGDSVRRVVAVVGAIVFLGAAACGTQGARVAAAPSTAQAGGTAAQTPSSTGATSTPEHVDLAPAGPAPGGPGDEDEGEKFPIAAALALKVGCEDLESQAHVPAVSEQLSCRLGVEHVYVITFRTAADRDSYLRGQQVVSGGFNVVGPTWVLHLEDPASSTAVARQLGGALQSGA